MTVQSIAKQPKPDSQGVLLIHASAGTGRSWAAVASSLANLYNVVVPDRLGYGRGDVWSTGTPAPLEAEAQHLAGFLCTHDEGVHVVAHSYGGAVAIELALRWPHLVRSLTLFEPGRFALLLDRTDCDDERGEIVQVGRTVGLWTMSGRSEAAAAMFIDYWSGPGTWDQLDDAKRKRIAGYMPKVAAEFDAAFADRTPLTRYKALGMPVHLMMGSTSPAPVRRIVGIMAEVLPNACTVELTGVGHMGPVTHPAQFMAQLPTWLTTEPMKLAA